MSMHVATSPLVGRDTELEVLRTLLSKVRDDQAQVVALAGPAGIGKSRLAEECLALARGSGFLGLRGAGGALQQDLAYAPLVEALGSLVREGSGPGRSALVEGLRDLGRLFGDLSLPAGPSLGDPGLERIRLFESVCRLLERASARQPLALLLDDVHWADRGSLALLHYLVRGLAGRPLLVVLTYRADETYPALDELLAGLRRAELPRRRVRWPRSPPAPPGVRRCVGYSRTVPQPGRCSVRTRVSPRCSRATSGSTAAGR